MQELTKEAIWLVVSGAASFGLWAWAANASPAAAQTQEQPANAAAPTRSPASGALEGQEGARITPSDPSQDVATDGTEFATPSAEELARRQAILEGTHLSPPSEPPLPSQSLIKKAPLQTSLAGATSLATVALAIKFLHALALLVLGR